MGRFEEAGDVFDGLVGTETDVHTRQSLARERAWIHFHRPGGLAEARSVLESAADAFGDLGLSVLAAEAATEASRCWMAARQLARASAMSRAAAGHLAHAEAQSPSASALGDRAGLASLTRRENEVATLAGRGLSNAAIADRLVVSVRTVESHLYAAFAKLGVVDRAELATLVRPR